MSWRFSPTFPSESFTVLTLTPESHSGSTPILITVDFFMTTKQLTPFSKKTEWMSVQFSLVQSLSHVQLFATPWTAALQASLSITISRSSLKFTSIESVMPSSHLILWVPFSSCLQSLPAAESFPMSQLLAWGGQSTGVSALASFLPKNPRTDLL